MTAIQSEPILALSLIHANETGKPVFELPPQWGGVPLNLYRIPPYSDRGPCHVDCPVLNINVNSNGRRWHRQNGKVHEFRIVPGEMDLYGKDFQRESLRSEATPGYSVGVRLPPTITKRLAPELMDFDMETTHDLFDPTLRWLVHELLEEAQRGAPGGRLYAESLSCALIARLAKYYGRRKAPDHPVGGLSASNQRRVIDFIEDHLREELGIAVLAKEVCLCPDHFSRCFSASFGQPPHYYVQQRRVEMALKMLKMSTRSVAEIAMELGFSSQAHFAHVFRQHTGVTPTRARRP